MQPNKVMRLDNYVTNQRYICNATTEHKEQIFFEDNAEKETLILPCACIDCLAKQFEFEIDLPMSTLKYSTDELIKMGYVGLYRPKYLIEDDVLELENNIPNEPYISIEDKLYIEIIDMDINDLEEMLIEETDYKTIEDTFFSSLYDF